MPDMLVKLYDLPSNTALVEKLKQEGIILRRGLVPEKHLVLDWVGQLFKDHWRSECDAAYNRQPVSILLAMRAGAGVEGLLGFACYDAVARGFFGPTGVHPDARGKGIGQALLVATLEAMREEGYGYAVIGGAGPVDFYQKAVGAIAIPDSVPGVYRDMLR